TSLTSRRRQTLIWTLPTLSLPTPRPACPHPIKRSYGFQEEALMAFKRRKPVRPSAGIPIADQIRPALRHAYALKNQGRREEARVELENLHRRYPGRTEPLSLLLEIALESGDMASYEEV